MLIKKQSIKYYIFYQTYIVGVKNPGSTSGENKPDIYDGYKNKKAAIFAALKYHRDRKIYRKLNWAWPITLSPS